MTMMLPFSSQQQQQRTTGAPLIQTYTTVVVRPLQLVVVVVVQLLCSLVIQTAYSTELQWVKLSLSDKLAPLPRQQCALVYYEFTDEVLVFGGKKGSIIFDDTWVYSVSDRYWSSVVYDGVKPAARYSMVAGVSESYLYVTMGQGRDNVYYNDIWKLGLGGPSYRWEEVIPVTGVIPNPRYGAVGGTYNDAGYLYISLGFSNQRQYSTYRFDTEQDVWEEVANHIHPYSPLHPNARKFHSGTMTDENQLFIDGGCLSGGGTGGPCPGSDSWVLDGDIRSWRRVIDCGPARMLSAMALLPAATVDGVIVSRVVMYGGVDHSNQYLSYTSLNDNEVMVMDVLSEQWEIKSIVSSDIPSWRSGHSMVTTQSGVVMFGGETSSGLTNELWLLSGDSADVDNTTTSTEHHCWAYSITYITIHGCLMFIGSAFFLQIGGCVARYVNVVTHSWKTLVHIIIQTCGVFICMCGLVFACLSVQSAHFQFAHGVLGLVIIIMCLLQPCNALIRVALLNSQSDFDWRLKLWKHFHSTSGRLVLVLSFVNISLGLFLAVADDYLWMGWLVFVGVIIIFYVLSEIYLQLTISFSKRKQRDERVEMDPLSR